MNKILSVHEKCSFADEFVLFDTNVWIAIYGNDPRPEKQIYSDFYAEVMRAGNTVVVNEQIICEFFNRVCKIEFEGLFGRNRWRDYKALRKTDAIFMARVQAVKDICLEILGDCEYQQSNLRQDFLERNLDMVAKGEIDLTDATLISECVAGDFILVSHDGDFAASNIKFATGNLKVLKQIAPGQSSSAPESA